MQNNIEKTKVKSKLKEIIMAQMENDEEIKFEEEKFSLDKVGYDSVKFVELIVEIEDTFQVAFCDEDLDLEKLLIFSELEKLLEKYVNNSDRE